MTRSSQIAIIGAPLDFGAGRRGVDMGPSALRLGGLNARLQALGYQVRDLGNVPVAQQETIDQGSPTAKYLAPIAQCCSQLAQTVSDIIENNQFPLVLGGDHSVGAGSVAGVSNALRKRGQKIGVIWIDAHADMNTPEISPSGNVHGMPLASCLGRGPRELTEIFGFSPKMDARNTVLIGLRDVDEGEREMVRELGVITYTMRDIDELGLRKVMEQALAAATDGTAGFHLSLDMDAVDPDEAPGVGTPVRGGMSYREAHLSMEMVSDSGKMLSMEIVEVNPVLDTANRTALLGIELVTSAMGEENSVSFINGLAKFYSYLFNLAVSTVLIGIAIIATTSHQALRLDMLPFEQGRLVSRISLMALIGFICVFLAWVRIFEVVYPLWSLALLVLIVWGFFFTPYSFHGPISLSEALWLILAAFFAFYGSLMILMPQRRNRW